jgi:hypothetical protein
LTPAPYRHIFHFYLFHPHKGVYAIPFDSRLTFRQARFCHAYLRCANATQAAVEAGYSEASARNQAYRLLQTERIRVYINRIQEDAGVLAGTGFYVVVGKLQNVYERALQARQFHAAARAVEIQSRLLGMHLRSSLRRPAPRPAAPPPSAAQPEDDISDIAPWATGAKKW